MSEQTIEEYRKQVHATIHQHIELRERRMADLKSERDAHPMSAIDREKMMEVVQHSIFALLHLEHDLHLCDCPPEAYVTNSFR